MESQRNSRGQGGRKGGGKDISRGRRSRFDDWGRRGSRVDEGTVWLAQSPRDRYRGRDLSRCAASIARIERMYARQRELTVFRQQRNTCEYNRMSRRIRISATPTFFLPVGRAPRGHLRGWAKQGNREKEEMDRFFRLDSAWNLYTNSLSQNSLDSSKIGKNNLKLLIIH